MGRSLKHLLQVVSDLQQLGVGLVSLTDALNTPSAQGHLIFNLFASLAEFERELIRERTHAGLASARARGRVGGRQRGISEEAERTAHIAETLYREQQLGVDEIAQRLRISYVTIYSTARSSSTRTVNQQLATRSFNFWTKLLIKAKVGQRISLPAGNSILFFAARCPPPLIRNRSVFPPVMRHPRR